MSGMSNFDPTQHPRGNTVTGHAGQFAAKQHFTPELGLDTAVTPDELAEQVTNWAQANGLSMTTSEPDVVNGLGAAHTIDSADGRRSVVIQDNRLSDESDATGWVGYSYERVDGETVSGQVGFGDGTAGLDTFLRQGLACENEEAA